MMRESRERTAVAFRVHEKKRKERNKKGLFSFPERRRKRLTVLTVQGRRGGEERPHDDGSIFGQKEEGGRGEPSKRRYSIMGHSGNTGGEEEGRRKTEEGKILFYGHQGGRETQLKVLVNLKVSKAVILEPPFRSGRNYPPFKGREFVILPLPLCHAPFPTSRSRVPIWHMSSAPSNHGPAAELAASNGSLEEDGGGGGDDSCLS